MIPYRRMRRTRLAPKKYSWNNAANKLLGRQPRSGGWHPPLAYYGRDKAVRQAFKYRGALLARRNTKYKRLWASRAVKTALLWKQRNR